MLSDVSMRVPLSLRALIFVCVMMRRML